MVPVENRVPMAIAAMTTPFDFDLHSYFDWEMTAAAVGRQGRGRCRLETEHQRR